MRLADWVQRLHEHPELEPVLALFHQGGIWQSVCPESRPVLLAAAWLQRPCKVLLVCASYDRALQWQARLALCGVPASQIRLMPSGQSALFEDAAPETVALSDRIGALKFLQDPTPGFVIAVPQASLERTLPPDVLAEAFIHVRKGEEVFGDAVVRGLVTLGYEVSEPVRTPGHFSRRGGILDIFPMGKDRPVRLEFFGDEVETIREFDPNTQRSMRSMESLTLAPSRETLLPAEPESMVSMLRDAAARDASLLGETEAARLLEHIESDLVGLDNRVFFDRLDLYRPWLYPDSGCAMDLLPEDGILVLDEPLEVETLIDRSEDELGQALEARSARGEILQSTPHDFLLNAGHFAKAPRLLAMLAIGQAPDWFPKLPEVEVGAQSMEPYRGQPHALTQTLTNWLSHHFCVVLSTDQPSRARSVLSQVELIPSSVPGEGIPPGLWQADGNLAGGFVLPAAALAVVTDQELFGVARLKLPQRKFSEGVPIATVLDLKPGDYVVHINFGIGVYRGLVKQMKEGVEREFLFIEYQPPDKLFVPADQLDRVQKYLAPGDAAPKVNRLTGGEWQKAIAKAREEAREFARDLIRLYAKRKAVERPSYASDQPWQAEMEATFPWVETPSQLSSIQDVKSDLQTPYPMDRLVCGDVGFGKTEVAIRAAFKVALEGRQVAVLCPTTILSEQHYRSFCERLAAFPIKVDYLNRFRSISERNDIARRLQSGELDIVVGTHALLGKDLKFKNLGLLVIDEEQKFGVRHKEALKKLRVSVDVLSMSATPIPRTLSMALMNIRQLSVINDPPPGRLPIRTYVRPFAPEVVREAMLREIARGGQVYYVYNRVDGIHHVAERLRKLLPSARIAVGHGQMGEREIEPVMLGFIRGEVDVLLSTTIIENGLDIPNANTLIVENADRFGLSQLYQLRGRVGRSDRQAYAYLLYEGRKSLTEPAMQRLAALQEFSTLGSGYSLAFRDLQIRGAGEMLGARQSGQMQAVGYDLYTQLIESELEFLKGYADGDNGLELKDPLQGLTPLPTVDLPVVALIPEAYIPDQGQRLYMYKRMMGSRSIAELSDVSRELEDRYGKRPKPVDEALVVMECRVHADALGIDKVEVDITGRMVAVFRESYSQRVVSLLTRRVQGAKWSSGKLSWPFSGSPTRACRVMLEQISQIEAEVASQRAALGVGS